MNNKKSLELLFKSYSRGMFNICLRMLNNRQDAEDVLHDAFYAAFMNYGKLNDKEKFGSWLKKIVINHCVSFVRKKVYFVDIEEYNEVSCDEDIGWLQELSMKDINNEIRKLPDGCRIVFNMFLLDNYSHKAIAEMLDISESTSKSQYRRAKQILKNKLKVKLNNG